MRSEEWQPIAERFNLRPALLSEVAAYNLSLLPMASASTLSALGPQIDTPAGSGIAVIPISGTLIANDTSIGRYRTGYDGITQMIAAAVASPQVRGIALLVDSPGGQLAGCLDCATAIAAANKVKPVWALAKHSAQSAAYALASSANLLMGTTSSQVGSIGVVLAHMDMSKMLDEFGLKVTLIHAGARKVDGNPFAPLPEPVRDRLQAEIEDARQSFASLVAKNRGMDVEAVLATEAGTFVIHEAMRLGLADGVATQEEFFTAFGTYLDTRSRGAQSASPSNRSRGVQHMSDQSQGGATPVVQVTAEQLNAARAEGASAERARIGAILTGENAKGRDDQAMYLALKTDMGAEAACGLLAASPLAVVGSGSALDRAMAGEITPVIGAGNGDEAAAAAPRIKAPSQIYGSRAASVSHLNGRG